LTHVLHKRIIKKARYPKLQKAKLETFWGKENVPAKVIYGRIRSFKQVEKEIFSKVGTTGKGTYYVSKKTKGT